MVDLLEERGSTAFEAFHDGELPQRTGPVEGRRRHRRRQVEQLPHPAGRRDGDGPEVVVEVEIVVGHPLGRGEAEGGSHDAVAEPWDRLDGLLDLGAHAGGVGCTLEDADVREVRAEGGVLLDRPHDRLGVAHSHWIRVSRGRWGRKRAVLVSARSGCA